MRVNISACVLLSACMVMQPAMAEQPLAAEIVPTMKLALPFGGTAARGIPFRFTAQLNYRWAGAQRVAANDQAPALDFTSGNFIALDVAQIAGNRDGLTMAHIFGHDVLANDRRLNEAGAESGGSHWYWWALGGVAVAAGVALAASGHHNDSNQSAAGNNGCSASGNVGSIQSGGICKP